MGSRRRTRGLAENDRYLARRRAGHGGCPRRVHVLATTRSPPQPSSPGSTASVCTSTSPKVRRRRRCRRATRRLTTDDWLLVHGVHLPDDHGLRGTIVHNPRSNMNNAVGYAAPARFANPVALGTDGIGADMLDEFRVAFVRAREHDVTIDARNRLGMARNRLVAVPRGADRPGDVVVRADRSVAARLHHRRTRGRRRGRRRTVLAGGVATRVDGDEVRAKAAEQAKRLFARLEEL